MKDIYELLNELNIDSSTIEETEVSEIERKKGKQKLMSSLKKKKNNRKKIFIAAASFLVIISMTSVTIKNPTWASNIPIIGDLFQKSLVEINKQYADYVNTVGQTKSHDGIDVTFENAVADNNMFIISFIVKNSNSPIENPEVLPVPMTLKINGNDVNTSGSSECEVIDKNTVRYLRKIDWEKEELPKYLNVNIGISEMFDKQGDWGVQFSMNTKEIQENTYVEKLNNKFKINNINFSMEQIAVSPLTTNIKYYAKSDDKHVHLDFLVLDQDNNEVKFMGGTSKDKDCKGGEEGKIKFNMNYINNGNITSLKLIPRYHDKSYEEKKVESKKINLDNFNPFEVKLSDNMSININKCTVDNGYLIVEANYTYLGKNVVAATGKVIDVKVNNILLEDKVENQDIYEKYKSKDNIVKMYKVDNVKDIDIDIYDGAAKALLEDEAITIIKK